MRTLTSQFLSLRPALVWGVSLLLLFSPVAFSANEQITSPPKPVPDPLSAEVISQLLFGLLVVVLLIFACAFLFKRFSGISYQGSQMKVVSGLSLGAKERLLLVQVGEQKQVLIGVAANGIYCITEFDSPVVEVGGDLSPFASRLREAMNKGKQ